MPSHSLHVNSHTHLVCKKLIISLLYSLSLHPCLRWVIFSASMVGFPKRMISLCVFHCTELQDENATKDLINTTEPRYLIKLQLCRRLRAKWRMGGRDEDASAGPWGLPARLSLVSIRLRAHRPLEESNLSRLQASDLRLTCKLSLFCASTQLGSTLDRCRERASGVSSVILAAVCEN